MSNFSNWMLYPKKINKNAIWKGYSNLINRFLLIISSDKSLNRGEYKIENLIKANHEVSNRFFISAASSD